jgi:hypothetical protein
VSTWPMLGSEACRQHTNVADDPTTATAMRTIKILRPRGLPDVDGGRESGCWFMWEILSWPDLATSDELTPGEIITQDSSQSYFHEQLVSTISAS